MISLCPDFEADFKGVLPLILQVKLKFINQMIDTFYPSIRAS